MKSLIPAFLMMATPLAAADLAAEIPAYEAAVRAEMLEWKLGGIAVAWIDGTSIVYEAGFGEAAKDSVFRAGSVSKLFNAVAVMQLVEQGKLDLDAPLPAGRMPVNPFNDAPVTLRQLLCHRSGLPREASVGGYFDDSAPSLEATVASLKGAVLVSPPDQENRYSNIGPSAAGLFAAEAAGTSFDRLAADGILKPLGMTRSAWLKKDAPPVIPSHIRVADGKGGYAGQATPLFDLGTIPAGNLYASAGDLGRFVAMLAADGDSPGGRVLKAETLHAMWQAQHDPKATFGLGYALGEWRGRKTVGHGGAVYGHSTALVYLPEEKIGVVVLCNDDIVNGRTQRLANLALSHLLKAKSGEAIPEPPSFAPAAADLAAMEGEWESDSFWLEIGPGTKGVLSGQPVTLRPVERDRFLLNSRLHVDQPFSVERDGAGRIAALVMGTQRFARIPAGRPPLPVEWKHLLGSYGPSFIPLVVHERNGRLYATTENMADYRLTPVNRHLFTFPPGLYQKEHLAFIPGRDGRPVAVDLAGMYLRRTD